MKRAASVVALVLIGSLLVASDVRGGAGGLVLPTKTTGSSLTATIVTDVTGTGTGVHPGKGQTSIRVQKGGSSAAGRGASSPASSPSHSGRAWRAAPLAIARSPTTCSRSRCR